MKKWSPKENSIIKKILEKLRHLKRISVYIKSIEFWTMVGSIATVIGLVFAILSYISKDTLPVPISTKTIISDSLKVKKNEKKNTLVMGVVNAVDKYKYIEWYTPFVKYIANKVDMENYQLEVVSYDSITKYLLNNKIDIAVFSPFSYINAKELHPSEDINLFALPYTHNRLYYHSVIVTLKESNIKKIEDLQNKTFAFTHTLSTSGYRIPSAQLSRNNVITKKPIWSEGHTASIDLLKSKKVDAIATYKEVFIENKEDLNNYRFIFESKGIPNNAYVLSPKLDEDLKNRIKIVMYSAHRDISTKEMFSNNDIAISKWVEADDSDYNELRRLLKKSRLKKKFKFNIELTENQKEFYKKSDIIPYLTDRVITKLNNSNRFWNTNKDKKNASCGEDLIDLKIFRINEILKIELFLNGKLLDIDESISFDKNELTNRLPKFIVETILKEMNITTAINYDPKNDYCFIEYGKEDGINLWQYDYILNLKNGTKKIIDSKDFKKADITKNLISLPKKYNALYENTKGLSIQYKN